MAETEKRELVWHVVGKQLEKEDKERLKALTGKNPHILLFLRSATDRVSLRDYMWEEMRKALPLAFRKVCSKDAPIQDLGYVLIGLDNEEIRELAFVIRPEDRTRILVEAVHRFDQLHHRDVLFGQVADYLALPGMDSITKGAATVGKIESRKGKMIMPGDEDDEV